jgi:hypothetical protein
LNTSWINYEIEKLVSTFYFVIVLIFLIIIVENPQHYNNYLKIVSLNLNSRNNTELYNELRTPLLQGLQLS